MTTHNAKAVEIVTLLTPAALHRLATDLDKVGRERRARADMPGYMAILARPLDRAAEIVELLTAPSINTVVATMASLDPTMQALVSDVVLQLANAGTGRQHLAIALRKLIEGRS